MTKGRKSDATYLASRLPVDRSGGRHHLAKAVRLATVALALIGGGAMAQVQTALAEPAPAPGPPLAVSTIAPADEVLAGLPETLLGSPARRIAGSPLVIFFPASLGKDPMVGVIAARSTDTSSLDMLRTNARGAFHESGLRRIIREGSFTTPKWPGARTFFGEYQTGSGFKQSWSVETGTARIGVVATYFDSKDSDRVQAEVSDKIFGGAVITASKPTE
jgi:hypothetical protein